MTDLGWTPDIGLREGLERTYRWFLEHGAERAATAAPNQRRFTRPDRSKPRARSPTRTLVPGALIP